MDVSMDVDTNLREKTAPSRLTLSPRSGSSRTVGHEGCALQALAFLASQRDVSVNAAKGEESVLAGLVKSIPMLQDADAAGSTSV